MASSTRTLVLPGFSCELSGEARSDTWHRLFGLTWIDYFSGTSIQVETELAMSLKPQLLDLVFLNPTRQPLPFSLPDGFEDLSTYNLVTYKFDYEPVAEYLGLSFGQVAGLV